LISSLDRDISELWHGRSFDDAYGLNQMERAGRWDMGMYIIPHLKRVRPRFILKLVGSASSIFFSRHLDSSCIPFFHCALIGGNLLSWVVLGVWLAITRPFPILELSILVQCSAAQGSVLFGL
jgi:hypothetical protein